MHICNFFYNFAAGIIPKTLIHMERIKKIVRFYVDGFKNMTWGKELWLLIIIKLVIMLGILRLFFLFSSLFWREIFYTLKISA